MNKKTVWIIVIVAIIAGVIGYFLWKNDKAKKRQELLAGVTEAGTTSATGSSPGGSSSGSSKGDAFPLGIGAKGNNVLASQIAINEGCSALSEKISEDGSFGPQTEAAADICLGSRNGHMKGQISFIEYQWMRNNIITAEELQIKEGCTASEASKLMMLTVYGIDCAKKGF